MPVLSHSSYSPPLWLRNGHVQTVWPALFRKVALSCPVRERLHTADGDFVDIDHFTVNHGRRCRDCVLLSHGLEGNSRRPYMLGMARAFNELGWDVVSRNFRGCSGEPNVKISMYHCGETDDLHLVVRHCLSLGYTRVMLVGFSMGGNQTLKYLGENPDRVPAQVKGAVAVSVPCDMAGSAEVLSRPSRAPYMEYFLRSLRLKVEVKHALFPHRIDIRDLAHITTFHEFDERYTAPLHGFVCARQYWEESGCLKVLAQIQIPTLLMNAEDDPFMSPDCYPWDVAREHSFLHLEVPQWGGHVGFVDVTGPRYWSERRAVDFVHKVCVHA